MRRWGGEGVFEIHFEDRVRGISRRIGSENETIRPAFKISGIEQPKDGFAKICGSLRSIRNHVCIWCLLGTVRGFARQEREKLNWL